MENNWNHILVCAEVITLLFIVINRKWTFGFYGFWVRCSRLSRIGWNDVIWHWKCTIRIFHYHWNDGIKYFHGFYHETMQILRIKAVLPWRTTYHSSHSTIIDKTTWDSFSGRCIRRVCESVYHNITMKIAFFHL